MSLIVILIMITSANVMAFLLLSFKGANFILDLVCFIYEDFSDVE